MKAFPSIYGLGGGGGGGNINTGMDLRDYFAAHCPFEITDLDCYCKVDCEDLSPKQLIERLAEFRYLYADAMLLARRYE